MEERNYARFYILLKQMPCADKETMVYQYTHGRTEHLHQMTSQEYDTMCRDMERIIGYDKRQDSIRKALRKARSGVLHQMQLYGVDTTNWNKVNAFCHNPRIAGKEFRELSIDELTKVETKIRIIRRKS